jgi:hypothetical protein
VPTKSAYKRPYKTRRERRETDRNKHADSHDHKFLKRVGVGVALLLLLAVAFAIKGLVDRENAMPPRSNSGSVQ